jgi:predicted AlkP superfamily phosphohydrolase/phosphomutase
MPHWPDMDAFALPSFYDGQIRFNLEGREARGRVALADYDAMCSRIEDDLRACVDPINGKSVVHDIVRTTHADPRTLGPTEADLVVVWEDAALAFVHPKHGAIGPLPYRRPGGHTGDHGVAILAGSDIEPGFYGTRSAFDVVPTICDYVTGSVVPEMSGKSFVADLVA